jgi:integrase
MAKGILTQRALEAAQPKPAMYPMKDGVIPGLRCLVHPTSKKVFRLSRRLNGKLTHFTVGESSTMTLGEARAVAKAFIGGIDRGEDPREAKRAAAQGTADTVEAVAKLFIERHAKVHNRPSSWVEKERLLDRNVPPAWGKRPIASVTRRDAITLLDAIVDRGSPVAANRVLAVVRKMFGWAIERGVIEASPFDRIKAPTPETSRDRTPNDAELALILRAAGTLDHPFKPFIKLLTYLGQRRSEVAGMRWSELNSDLTTWTLPRARVKNDTEHVVPIAPQVKAILVAAPRFEGSDYVITFDGRAPTTAFSQCKSELDGAIANFNGGAPLPDWRIHDLRRSVASGMAKMGTQMPVVERVLNHVSGSFGGVAGIYQRHDFADEKRAALEGWAEHLSGLSVP